MIKVDILQAWQFFWSLNCEENLQRKKGVNIQNQGKSKDAKTGGGSFWVMELRSKTIQSTWLILVVVEGQAGLDGTLEGLNVKEGRASLLF